MIRRAPCAVQLTAARFRVGLMAGSLVSVLHCNAKGRISRTEDQLNAAFTAHHWGIKAAQAELPLTSNPYRTPQTRAAWLAGYRQEQNAAGVLAR